MPDAIIAGLPIAYDKRVQDFRRRDEEPVHPEWTLEFVRSTNRKYPTINLSYIKELLQGALSGPHVLAFRPDQAASRVREELVPAFRFRWLDRYLLQLAAGDPEEFVTRLRSELQIESEWRDRVSPDDYRSPLLLPECSFATSRKHSRLWRLAQDAGDLGRIEAAQRAVEVFRQHHFRNLGSGRRWIDEGRLVFDHLGPRHAVAPFPRDWKYSFPLPSGFHYDVTHADGRGFTVCNYLGTSHARNAGGHVNVDPHGYVR